MGPIKETELDQAVNLAKPWLWGVFGLSCFLNLLYLVPPIYLMQVFDRVLITGNIETLGYLTLLALTALILLGALDALRSSIFHRMGAWLTETVSPRLIRIATDRRGNEDAVGSRALSDLNTVQRFVGGQRLSLLFDAPWLPVFLIFIFAINFYLGLLALSVAALLLVLSIANDRLTRQPIEASAAANRAALSTLDAFSRNSGVVRSMGMADAVLARWRLFLGATAQAESVAAERGGAIHGASKFIRLTAQVLVLGLGALLVIQGQISAGAMVAASILMGRALAPVEQLIGGWTALVNARGAFLRVRHTLRCHPQGQERLDLPAPQGRLSVESISVCFGADSPRVLKDVTFETQPGEVVGIIGPSASGKTTLVQTLIGNIEPSTGTIRLDGAELTHWDPQRLGRHIGFLPQAVELFDGTVAENISRLDRPEANAVLAAADRAGVHEMISRLPDGYETDIGADGSRLSAGQRQRIGLARALFGRPRYLVLDEPNANLDHDGEQALANAIATAKDDGTTVIIVSHRPSALRHADKVLVLNGGRVVAFAPRDEVLRALNTQPPEGLTQNQHGALPEPSHAPMIKGHQS